jgi:hypothetical protein
MLVGIPLACVAALVAVGLVAWRSLGANHPDPHPSRAASVQTHVPSAQPSPTSTLDSCLVGTWTGTSEDITNTINNEPVQFTGPGPTQTFQADGNGVTDYGTAGTVFTATVNGDQWTEIIKGRATWHYQAQHGSMLGSSVSPHGSWELLDNGVYNNGGPLSMQFGPETYTCSGNSLKEYLTNGAVELTRKLPSPPPGS